MTRHGDRQGFYQSPTTYTAKSTNLTVLGYAQEYKNGQDLRTLYLNGSNAIQGINATRAEGSQMRVMADAGGEGSVIVDSTNALLQGTYACMHAGAPHQQRRIVLTMHAAQASILRLMTQSCWPTEPRSPGRARS